MFRKTAAAAIGLILCGLLFVAPARADEWNKKTIVTTNVPIEIPGKVLSPGQYTFQLMDTPADRNIVQIFNKNDQLVATLLTIPDYRLKPTGQTVLKFAERPSNSPEALRAWFYPGDDYGQQFVYPKNRATDLAKANHIPVLEMPSELAGNISKPAKSSKEPQVEAMKNAEVKAVTPNGDEVDMSKVVSQHPSGRATAKR